MVVAGKARAIRYFTNSRNGFMKIFNEEFSVLKSSLKLNKIDFSNYRPRIAVTIIYSLLQTTLVSIIGLVVSLLKSKKDFNFVFYPVSFGCILIYSYGAGYFYKACFDKRDSYTFFMHVYICMYSISYLPVFCILQSIHKVLSWIFFLAFWILSEYALCLNYRDMILGSDDPQRTNFLLNISALVTQGIFLAAYSILLRYFFTCFLVRF
ncbi:hypothetical protein CWI39_0741p0010 [Hamiltosporidium magnivora]|uniref:Uncharacterized protein n=1 Tax=Hamiltosporidium magnivora TaxID=148818 RepID=A0A4Q9LDR2_9MICR|nr:hypothetical protein CWI39_0741p0010 [Hamiltosporidium magnivora]